MLEGTCEYDARAEAPTLVHVTALKTKHEELTLNTTSGGRAFNIAPNAPKASPHNTTNNGPAFDTAPRRRRSVPQATGARSVPHQYGVALWLFFGADGELLVEHERQDSTGMVTSQIPRATYGR